MKPILIQGYKCPYCGYSECNERSILEHMSHCFKNPDYTQKCIECNCLEKDWETRKLFDGKSICCYNEAECPFLHHDSKEIDKILSNLIADMRDKYGYKEEMKVVEAEFHGL